MVVSKRARRMATATFCVAVAVALVVVPVSHGQAVGYDGAIGIFIAGVCAWAAVSAR